MPKKIRELKQTLRQEGFTELTGKGSHTIWIRPLYIGKLTISGEDGIEALESLIMAYELSGDTLPAPKTVSMVT
jgi:predicted RNA binding protein YcfA (HicA-like mRNA interferase family)